MGSPLSEVCSPSLQEKLNHAHERREIPPRQGPRAPAPFAQGTGRVFGTPANRRPAFRQHPAGAAGVKLRQPRRSSRRVMAAILRSRRPAIAPYGPTRGPRRGGRKAAGAIRFINGPKIRRAPGHRPEATAAHASTARPGATLDPAAREALEGRLVGLRSSRTSAPGVESSRDAPARIRGPAARSGHFADQERIPRGRPPRPFEVPFAKAPSRIIKRTTVQEETV